MSRIVSVLCIVAASIFAALAALVLFTKLMSPTVRAMLFVAAFGVASFACSRAAARFWPTGRDIER